MCFAGPPGESTVPGSLITIGVRFIPSWLQVAVLSLSSNRPILSPHWIRSHLTHASNNVQSDYSSVVVIRGYWMPGSKLMQCGNKDFILVRLVGPKGYKLCSKEKLSTDTIFSMVMTYSLSEVTATLQTAVTSSVC